MHASRIRPAIRRSIGQASGQRQPGAGTSPRVERVMHGHYQPGRDRSPDQAERLMHLFPRGQQHAAVQRLQSQAGRASLFRAARPGATRRTARHPVAGQLQSAALQRLHHLGHVSTVPQSPCFPNKLQCFLTGFLPEPPLSVGGIVREGGAISTTGCVGGIPAWSGSLPRSAGPLTETCCIGQRLGGGDVVARRKPSSRWSTRSRTPGDRNMCPWPGKMASCARSPRDSATASDWLAGATRSAAPCSSKTGQPMACGTSDMHRADERRAAQVSGPAPSRRTRAVPRAAQQHPAPSNWPDRLWDISTKSATTGLPPAGCLRAEPKPGSTPTEPATAPTLGMPPSQASHPTCRHNARSARNS